MDEPIQLRLAKANINITDITDDHILFEFPYHPKPGEVRWCKSFITRGMVKFTYGDDSETKRAPLVKTILDIPDLVLEMRKSLER